jgi:hypothetical protein
MASTTLGYKLQVQQQQQYRRNNKQSQRLQIAMAYQQQQLGNGSSQSNQKSTQAYKLFGEGKTPVEVAIQLASLKRKQHDTIQSTGD